MDGEMTARDVKLTRRAFVSRLAWGTAGIALAQHGRAIAAPRPSPKNRAEQGKSIDFARKTAVLVVALMVVPIFFGSQTGHLWIAVTLVSLATAGHQGWAANIFTICSDIYPKNAVGSIVGLSGFCGAVGGMLVASAVGIILEITGSYYIIFAMASLAYLVAWLVIKVFIPRIEPLRLPGNATGRGM